MEYAFEGNYVNMIASRKSDQPSLLNLTLSICKDHQGPLFNNNIRKNFENMRESLRINYFAQLLVPVIHVTITIILLRIYLSSYNKT